MPHFKPPHIHVEGARSAAQWITAVQIFLAWYAAREANQNG